MNTEIIILVVDDEPDILEFVSYNLERQGYLVYQARSGREALLVAKDYNPHMILLDIMMPDLDGVTTCQQFRSDRLFNDTIIAFLTARHEEYSEIAGLAAGADDYIIKPISPGVLVSRVKALLRRHKNLQKRKDSIQLEGLYLNRDQYLVKVEEEILELARKEFEILWLMASKPGKVFNRNELYRNIWGNDVIVGNRTIDVHISKIRKKLNQKYIRTVKGLGYKIES